MPSDHYIGRWEKYILLHVLVYSIAENFYELCRILTSPQVESKNKKTSWILGIRYQEFNVPRKLRKFESSPFSQYPSVSHRSRKVIYISAGKAPSIICFYWGMKYSGIMMKDDIIAGEN